MNYQKIYESIIYKAQNKQRTKEKKSSLNYIYYERHHILPKCLGGKNDKNNLVLLTAREHYICHRLLVLIYPKNRKIIDAYHRMTFSKNGQYNLSARDYEYAKFLKSITPISEETRLKMKAHKFSEEHKRNLSESHKGPHPKDRNHANFSGEKNPMFGKKLSEESKNKIGGSKKGKPSFRLGKTLSGKHKENMRKPHGPMSEETKEKIRAKMKLIRNAS